MLMTMVIMAISMVMNNDQMLTINFIEGESDGGDEGNGSNDNDDDGGSGGGGPGVRYNKNNLTS